MIIFRNVTSARFHAGGGDASGPGAGSVLHDRRSALAASFRKLHAKEAGAVFNVCRQGDDAGALAGRGGPAV